MDTTAFATTIADRDRFSFLGHDWVERAGSDGTGGAYCLHEILQRPGHEPPLHVHTREDEMFHVLEGRMTFHVGDEMLVAEAGTTVHLPRGVPHTFTVDIGTARVLQLCVPGGIDRFFASWRDRDGTPDELAAGLAEYGVQITGPPARLRRAEL